MAEIHVTVMIEHAGRRVEVPTSTSTRRDVSAASDEQAPAAARRAIVVAGRQASAMLAAVTGERADTRLQGSLTRVEQYLHTREARASVPGSHLADEIHAFGTDRGIVALTHADLVRLLAVAREAL